MFHPSNDAALSRRERQDGRSSCLPTALARASERPDELTLLCGSGTHYWVCAWRCRSQPGQRCGTGGLRRVLLHKARGAVAGVVGIKGGVVSGVINLESPGVEVPGWRPRHEERYHAFDVCAA